MLIEEVSVDISSRFLDLNNFQQAFSKVAENRGCAGVDGETIDKFASNQIVNIYKLRDEVANNQYRASPCKQVIIPKKNGSQRELKIPTVRDRTVQQALLNVASPEMEQQFSAASFGYRPNLSYINAVEQIAHWRDRGYTWVLDADIVKFFDNIEHSQLLYQVRSHLDCPGILWLIRSWISAGVMTPEGLVIPQKGIPQGAVISPLLANIYLHPFDRVITDSDLQLVRYADDFLVLATSQERILQAKIEVNNLLTDIGLEINAEKTQITNFDRGFKFLGHGFLDRAIFPVDANSTSLRSALDKVADTIADRRNSQYRRKKKVSNQPQNMR
jgi:RNA-directed DNA polymerase